MAGDTSKLQKLAWRFSALFLFVYLLDFVPGIMAENGKMFGLFSTTPIVDFGHLALGALAAIAAWHSAKASRIYFYALGVWYGIDVIVFFVSHFNTMSPLVNAAVNMPHLLIATHVELPCGSCPSLKMLACLWGRLQSARGFSPASRCARQAASAGLKSRAD